MFLRPLLPPELKSSPPPFPFPPIRFLIIDVAPVVTFASPIPPPAE